jgi:sulfite reductase (ferredoxin)
MIMRSSFDFTNVDAAARRDIEELERRIAAYRQGKEDEERFRHYRLTRGVYGQRQIGVQMFRIKIPYGRLTARQLTRIADVSERYTNGNLHLTTRQNIQLHFVKLFDSPAIWTELAQEGITARESCGNTVRNLTASARAGIDPDEPFDVSPYAQAAFEYFLRNPICQDMGRKIKPAFSSSEKDSAFTYFHDFGFIPRLREENGQQARGFKVVVGGGLGAQSIVALTAYEFLPEDQIIPFMEACLRVFDRYGEREKRMKARLKFLIQKLGLPAFMELVEKERPSLRAQRYEVNRLATPEPAIPPRVDLPPLAPVDTARYEQWLRANVFEQKQKGFRGVQVRVRLGNLHADQARALAVLALQFAADDIRLTVNQGLLFKFVRPEYLPYLFNALDALDLAQPGFDTTADITACPGTDTCALGVTNSTGLAVRLEELIREEYPHLVEERDIHIKISGCMNSCGQHMAANIGFHGSSIKQGALVVPAMQVVLGGGVDPEGRGFVAEKVVKLPTKRIPDAVRALLDDYEAQAREEEYFNDYFQRRGKMYFYELLKPLANAQSLSDDDFIDWGHDRPYRQEIGVGECAGAMVDAVSAILHDAEEKLELAQKALAEAAYADSVYHAYTAFIIGAKALLLSADVKCNTHQGIINDFQVHYVANGDFYFEPDFSSHVLRHNKQEADRPFAEAYLAGANQFLARARGVREAQLARDGGQEKLVIDNYYKA